MRALTGWPACLIAAGLAMAPAVANAVPFSDELIVRQLGLGRMVKTLADSQEPGSVSFTLDPRVIEFTSNGKPTGRVDDRVTIGAITLTLASDGDSGPLMAPLLDPNAIRVGVDNERTTFRLRFVSNDEPGDNPSDVITVRGNGRQLLRFPLSNKDEKNGKSLDVTVPEIAFLFEEGEQDGLSDVFTVSSFTVKLESTDSPDGLGHQDGATTRRDSDTTVDLLRARAISDPVEIAEPSSLLALAGGLVALLIRPRRRTASSSA